MSGPRRVLVAFDKFKDALSARRACAIAARELRRAQPTWTVECAPITDGGDGFAAILTEAAGGELVRLRASGPRLEPHEVECGLVDARKLPAAARAMLPESGDEGGRRIAIVEMAAVNGLALLPPEARDPWSTTTYGTGQLIRAVAELGARTVLLGVGGSATNDLGLGALNALGFEFRDRAGNRVRPPFPSTWERIAQIEGEPYGSIPPIAIACDVTNPLLGPEGAASIYGPQKGLRVADLPRLEREAERIARLLAGYCGRDPADLLTAPGAGAAGGIAFGLMAAMRARLVPGAELVSAWLDLVPRIAAADVVITGEGRFDASSLAGKGPGAVVRQAQAAGHRVVVIAGAVADDVQAPGVEFVPVTPAGMPLDAALAQTDRLLAAAVARCFSAGGSVG